MKIVPVYLRRKFSRKRLEQALRNAAEETNLKVKVADVKKTSISFRTFC